MLAMPLPRWRSWTPGSGLPNGLVNSAEAMEGWNSKAGATVQMLKNLASGATSAAAAMSKLQSAFGGGVGPIATGRPLGANDLVAGAGVPGGVAAGMPPQQLPPIVPTIPTAPLDDAKTKIQGVILSWQTLSRVVMTQAIVRGLSDLRDATHEAFDSNLKFMNNLAEIQSISPGMGSSLDSIALRVANLSKNSTCPWRR